MKQLSVDGVEIAYLDAGKGPAVIIGHCSSASHKEWLPLIETLKSEWRVLAPDLIGYGQSAPWPADQPFSVGADVDVVLAIAKKAKGKLHLVGHSYGAALLLEAARTLGARVKSLTLVEPSLFHLLRGRPEWAEVETLARAVLGAVAKGDHRTAAKSFMTYCLGPLALVVVAGALQVGDRDDDSQGRARIRFRHRSTDDPARLCRDHRPHIADRRRLDGCAQPGHRRPPGNDPA